LQKLKISYLENLVANFPKVKMLEEDFEFLSNDINEDPKWIKEQIFNILIKMKEK